MGSWGVDIFSSDIAADIEDDFSNLLAEGHTPVEATHRLRRDYRIHGTSADDNDFWLGLAAVQYSLGRLVPEVLERARSIIHDPSELARWQPKDRERRRAVLRRLQEQLDQPLPAPQRVRPTRTVVQTKLLAGQHVLFQPRARRVLLRVTDVGEDKGGRYPVVVVLDWDGRDRQLRKAHRLPAVLAPASLREDEALGYALIGEPGDPDDLIVLDQRIDRRTPQRRWASRTLTKWSELERFLP